jgi:transcription elongation factor Elf1
MTKLKELKELKATATAKLDAAYVARGTACDADYATAAAAVDAAIDAAYDAWVAYYAELKKLQKDEDK